MKQPMAQWPTTTKDWWPIEKIKPYSNNPRTHPPEQIEMLAKLMKKYGIDQPIVVDEKGIIIKGHGRRLAAMEARFDRYPVVVHRGLSEDAKRAMRIADNQVALLSGWDDNLLRNEMTTLSTAGFDMALTGFGDKEVDRLVGTFSTSAADPDEIPKIKPTTLIKPGSMFELGEHRLICGDATERKTWDVLFGTSRPQMADMVFTDPPYGVSYQDASGSEVIIGDKKRRDDLYKMLARSLQLMVGITKDRAAFYIWHASATRRDFEQALLTAGLIERQYLIWAKPSLVIGRSDYQWAHEPCFYASRAEHSPNFYGDRAEPTVWRVEAVRTERVATVLGTGVLVLSGTGQQVFIAPRAPKGKRTREVRLSGAQPSLMLADSTGTGTVWEIGRDSNYVHPTQKPVALATRAIENSSKPGEVVVDGFSGSGTTLIACEMTGRRCRAVEMDPRYVEVTIRRWEKLTGYHARLHTAGEAPKRKAPRRASARPTEVLPDASGVTPG